MDQYLQVRLGTCREWNVYRGVLDKVWSVNPALWNKLIGALKEASICVK